MARHTQKASNNQAATFKHRSVCNFGLVALLALVSKDALAQVTVPAGASMRMPTGSTLNLACTIIDVAGSLSLSTSQLNAANGVRIQSGGGVNGGASTIYVSGNWSNSGIFTAGTSAVVFDDRCATGPITISGQTTFNHLTLSSNSGRTFVLPQGSNITVNGTLTLQGAPGKPITLQSSGGGTAVVNLGPGAQFVQSNANVGGNVQIGSTPPRPSTPASIPTLSEWGQLITATLVALLAVRTLRRRNPRA